MRNLLLLVIFFTGISANDYEQWLKEQASEYNQYKKSIDEEFTDMLKKDWKSFETMHEPTPYKKEKPKVLPKVKKEQKISKKEIQNSPKVKLKKIVKKKPVVKKEPIVQKPKVIENKEPIVVKKPQLPKEKELVKKEQPKVVEKKPTVKKEVIVEKPKLIEKKEPIVVKKPQLSKEKDPVKKELPKVVEKKPVLKEEPIVQKPILIKEPVVKKGPYLKETINFFNQNLTFKFKKRFDFRFKRVSKYEIGRSWDTLIKNDYKALISQVNTYKKEYELNDWALYQMLHLLGNKLFYDENKANIFTWFILTKMNYDTKIAYNKTRVFLLANVEQSLYQVSFFKLDSKRYFVLNPTGRIGSIGKIYSYAHSYPKANKKLSFDMNNKAINIYTDVKSRDLSFDFDKKQYEVNSSYSNDLIEFYKTFPQSQYDLYFNSKKSNELSSSLLLSLQPYLKGKSELEAVNFLLRFTQKAFEYQTDRQQFAYEKVMFPEETLYYAYSDCEDRSIMFSYLVENLLGLDVVGIKYKDHLSTAVNFSSRVSGASFSYKNSNYTMADPTYINANVGMVMPKYKNSRFKVIQ